jgi:hypothetical protein
MTEFAVTEHWPSRSQAQACVCCDGDRVYLQHDPRQLGPSGRRCHCQWQAVSRLGTRAQSHLRTVLRAHPRVLHLRYRPAAPRPTGSAPIAPSATGPPSPAPTDQHLDPAVCRMALQACQATSKSASATLRLRSGSAACPARATSRVARGAPSSEIGQARVAGLSRARVEGPRAHRADSVDGRAPASRAGRPSRTSAS